MNERQPSHERKTHLDETRPSGLLLGRNDVGTLDRGTSHDMISFRHVERLRGHRRRAGFGKDAHFGCGGGWGRAFWMKGELDPTVESFLVDTISSSVASFGITTPNLIRTFARPASHHPERPVHVAGAIFRPALAPRRAITSTPHQRRTEKRRYSPSCSDMMYCCMWMR